MLPFVVGVTLQAVVPRHAATAIQRIIELPCLFLEQPPLLSIATIPFRTRRSPPECDPGPDEPEQRGKYRIDIYHVRGTPLLASSGSARLK